MALARDHLRTGELGMAAVAASVGYNSPYAFAAFRRHHGDPRHLATPSIDRRHRTPARRPHIH
ncbi:hypothetical protein ACFY0P_28800 [Streptomyces sp. NPDC001714]|uniref:hypothetical protein n=1 Tax=Streptomyces sp. NPDC001714 TaxID=3364603 RepID=UPI0036A417C2